MSERGGKAASAIYGVFDRAWTAVCWPLIAVLNFFFRPDPHTGRVAFWRVTLWLAANAALLYVAVMDLARQNVDNPAVLEHEVSRPPTRGDFDALLEVHLALPSAPRHRNVSALVRHVRRGEVCHVAGQQQWADLLLDRIQYRV